MSTPFEFLNSSIRIAPGRRVVPATDYERYLQADEIVEEAHKQARKIHEEAVAAYEGQRLEGYKDGIAQANEEKVAYCFQVAKDFADALEGVEERLATLIPQILYNLFGDLGKDVIFTSHVNKALQDLAAEERLTLKVHPSKRRLMEEHVDELQKASDDAFKYLRVRGDGTLEEGQATIETASSIVVLDLQRQIDFIAAYVKERLQSQGATFSLEEQDSEHELVYDNHDDNQSESTKLSKSEKQEVDEEAFSLEEISILTDRT